MGRIYSVGKYKPARKKMKRRFATKAFFFRRCPCIMPRLPICHSLSTKNAQNATRLPTTGALLQVSETPARCMASTKTIAAASTDRLPTKSKWTSLPRREADTGCDSRRQEEQKDHSSCNGSNGNADPVAISSPTSFPGNKLSTKNTIASQHDL